MNIAVLWPFYLMSSSAGYNIQTLLFYIVFPSCIVDMFENKSKSVNILICTPNPCILQLFHEHKIQVFIDLVFYIVFFYIVHRQLIHMSNPLSCIFVIEPCI